MSSIYQVINNMVQPYKQIILIVCLVLLFFIAGYFTVKYYLKGQVVAEKQSKFNNVANADPSLKEIEMYCFNVTWCPHCHNAKGIWEDFINANNGREINGYRIHIKSFDETDITNENDEAQNAMRTEFNITSYPTVVMVKDGEQIVFDAKITLDNLNQFIESV